MKNEKLRELLTEIRRHNSSGLTKDMQGRIDAALSQQAEPECRCTMRQRLVGDGCSVCNPEYAADHEAGPCEFHDSDQAACQQYSGQVPCEPVPAQDEREAFEDWCNCDLSRTTPDGPYRYSPASAYWRAWQARAELANRATRPAQTEQQATVKDCLTVQPMAYAVFAANGNAVCFSTRRDHPSLVALEKEGHSVVSLAPIAQTAPQHDSDCSLSRDSQ